MKIILINPSSYIKNAFPPLGLLYLSCALSKKGHVVKFIEEAYEKQVVLKAIKQFEPDVCCLALYTTNLSRVFNLIYKIKDTIKTPIVVGGPHASALPQKTLQECQSIDYLIQGEGEIVLPKLLKFISQGKPPDKELPGVWFRKEDFYYCTGKPQRIFNLDLLDFPDHGIAQKYSYSYDWARCGKKVALVCASRGCPYNCSFCFKGVFGSNVIRRTPKNILQEMIWLNEKFSYDEVFFVDELFASNRKWLREFCDLLKENRLYLPWRCLIRADSATAEDLNLMRDAGCFQISMGVETGNTKLLQKTGKHLSLSQVERIVKVARNLGLTIQTYFIFGHQDETMKTIQDSFNFGKKLNTDFAAFSMMAPYPGTKNYQAVSKEEKYLWCRYTDDPGVGDPISICAVPSHKLRQLSYSANRLYYERISYIRENVLCRRRIPLRQRQLRLMISLKGINTRIRKNNLTESLLR